MLNVLRASPLGRFARQLRWSLAGRPASTAINGRLSVRSAPPVMESGVATEWVVRVENHSRRVWSRSGPDAVALQGRWQTRTGNDYGKPIDAPLPRTLLPGDWADVRIAVIGPAAVGDFTLAW